MTHTIKLTILTSLFALLAACSSADTTSSDGGSAATTTTTTTSSTTTSSSNTTSSSSTSSTACVPGAKPCNKPVVDGYPDPLASFDASADNFDFIGPIPPHEVGHGAAAARLGPFNGDITIALVSARVSSFVSAPVRLAVWTEPQCGLPTDAPEIHATPKMLDELSPEAMPDGTLQITLTLDTPVTVPEGGSAYVAYMLDDAQNAIAVYPPTGDKAPRALWYGLVDNDCDKETDTNLGWAYLDSPTSPDVAPYHYDEAFFLTLQ